MKESFLGNIFTFCNKQVQKFKKINWSNPKNPLILIAVIITPFVAWYYVSTGFVIGLLMAVSILWLLEKSPYCFKYLVASFPLTSDILLSTALIVMFGSYFGSGLTLGIAAVCTAIILSWGLEVFSTKFKEDRQKRRYEAAFST